MAARLREDGCHIISNGDMKMCGVPSYYLWSTVQIYLMLFAGPPHAKLSTNLIRVFQKSSGCECVLMGNVYSPCCC